MACFVISFIGGFLIDIDHFIDYYIQEGPSLNFSRFYHYCVERRFIYLSLIFHSLEFLFLLWFLIYAFKLGIFWISLSIGISQHMLFDIIGNSAHLKTHSFYFITLRALKGFRFNEFKR